VTRSVLLLAALLLSCSGLRRAPQDALAPELDQEERRAIAEWQEARGQLAARRGAGDCSEVCRLAALICRASERICVIAGRHPGEASYAGACTAARADCEEGRGECSRCRP
jgi:hypothetical protein